MIVDAHEDLAWNMLNYQRDYTRSIGQTRRLEQGTATVEHNSHSLLGWPDWVEGEVGWVFATLFVTPEQKREGPWETVTYRDPEQAHQRYWHQLDLYHRLLDDHPDKFRLIDSAESLAQHQAEWASGQRRLGITLLMEGAEGIAHPQQLPEWHRRGLRVVGPAWDRTRYVGSCYTPGTWTKEGRQLLEVMAELKMVLDLSHLSEQAALEALDIYPGVIIASHANPRWLMPNASYPERFLGRETVQGLAQRGGVIGIVLYNRFLKDGWNIGDDRSLVTVDDVVAHIDAICQLLGSADHVGLGSDFDGGFGLAGVPSDLDGVGDLDKIGTALARHGYGEGDMLKVLGGNWTRIMQRAFS
jgi:membrane dipeptidase